MSPLPASTVRLRTGLECLVTASIQHGTKGSNQSCEARKIKGIQIGKEEVKLYLADDIILSVKNSKDIKLLEFMMSSSKLQDIKSICKNLLYLYTLSMNNLEMEF